MKFKFSTTILCFVTILLFASCGGSSVHNPKPRGYIRIDLPESTYVDYDTTALPFRFERNDKTTVDLKRDEKRLKWVDLRYPDLNAYIFMTYIPLEKTSDLAGEVDTSYKLLSQHFEFSSGITEFLYDNKEAHVYATTYKLRGKNVASTYQFWATDSVQHFLRGSLYIDCVPNNDSLAPVLKYLHIDIDHILETLEWK